MRAGARWSSQSLSAGHSSERARLPPPARWLKEWSPPAQVTRLLCEHIPNESIEPETVSTTPATTAVVQVVAAAETCAGVERETANDRSLCAVDLDAR